MTRAKAPTQVADVHCETLARGPASMHRLPTKPLVLRLSIWWLLAVPPVCMACSEAPCIATPAIFVVPADTTIAPGQSFTARMETSDPCGKGGPSEIRATNWAKGDTNTVRVDALSGLVTGRAIGDAALFSSVGGRPATVHVR
jgi:hypothetical protein